MNDMKALERLILNHIRIGREPVDVTDLVAAFSSEPESAVRRCVAKMVDTAHLKFNSEMRLILYGASVDLDDLMILANAACEAAREVRAEIAGDVEWRDLRCVDAEWFISRQNEMAAVPRVYLAGAHPLADDLRDWVADWMAARGAHGVHVVMDW